MNTHVDINDMFIDLHTQHRDGKLSREEYDTKIRAMLVAAGKLPGRHPLPETTNFAIETEHSGCLSYDWKPDGTLSIGFRTPWDGAHKLNAYPRHLRQAARMELDSSMTEKEATKLQVAHAAGDAMHEAVMDDLLCQRAEEMLQRQGTDTRRAINIDERFHLAENPDVIAEDDLATLVHGAVRDPEMDR